MSCQCMDATNRFLLHHHFLSDWGKENDPISVIVSRISQSLSTKLLAAFGLRLTHKNHVRCGGNVQIIALQCPPAGTAPTWMKTRALSPQTRNKSTSQVPSLRGRQGTTRVKVKSHKSRCRRCEHSDSVPVCPQVSPEAVVQNLEPSAKTCLCQ